MSNIVLELGEIKAKLAKAAELLADPAKDNEVQSLLEEIHDEWINLEGNSELDDIALGVMNIYGALENDTLDGDDEEFDRTHSIRLLKRYRDEVSDRIDELEAEESESELSSSDDTNSESEHSDSENEQKEGIILSPKTGKIRQKISDKFEGYENADEAKEKEWRRANKAERRFYDMARNKNRETQRLSDSFLFNRRTPDETRTIDSNNKSARTLITADADAIKQSLQNIRPAELKTGNDISTLLGWHKKKTHDWNRESVNRGHKTVGDQKRDTVIKYQFHPSAGNLANIMISGVGRYGVGAAGKTPNILQVINGITDEKPAKEKKLAEMLIGFSRFGGGFTAELLQKEKFNLHTKKPKRDQQVEQLNRLAYLVCIKEISRRKSQGMKNTRHGMREVEELPFGIAISNTLQLLKDGHLRMQQVFDRNSPYGVFTGEEIMHDKNIAKTKEKFAAVFQLYNEMYGGEEAKQFLRQYPNGKVIAFRETHHKDLLSVNGGEADSSGGEYESSDEETRALITSTRRLTL